MSIARVLKLERERKLVLSSLASDFVKQRLVAELDAALAALEAEMKAKLLPPSEAAVSAVQAVPGRPVK